MKSAVWGGLAVLIIAAIAYGMFSLSRSEYHLWRADLEMRQQEAAERRAEQARLAEAEAARQRAAEAAAATGTGPTVGGGGFNPLAPRPTVGGAATASDVPTNPDFGNLPDTEGVEVVYYACTACHSAAMFTQQHVTRERWDYLLDWMVETQGMNEPPPEDRQVMLDYLTRHFGAE